MDNPKVIDLCGKWQLSSSQEEKIFPAAVPGCVHLDLLEEEAIPDPYYRDNEDRLQWIGETDWSYRRTFAVSPEMLEHDRAVLRCEGLDTFARIAINGKQIARTDNMFRVWEFDILEFLHPGENEIEVYFESTIPYINKKQEEQFLWHTGFGNHCINGRNWVRKEQCNYGWDWGPSLVTCGIWRPLCIIGLDTARLEDVHVEQEHGADGSVLLHISLSAEILDNSSAFSSAVSLSLDGRTLASVDVPLKKGECVAELIVKDPELWWPNGMGKQPLYRLNVVLFDDTSNVLDEKTIRLGLRSLELIQDKDEWGQSFKFRANGTDFFAKGANWIPADTFDGRVSEDDLRDLLQSAADANMNMVRVWGGGLYERDSFYDICDELGLCVWQDFMFACAAYPARDPEFMENVRIEAEQNVMRLRSHPSIALWCGNNELEQIPKIIGDKPGEMTWKDYSALFDVLLAEVVSSLDPQRSYWPSSGHSPGDRRANPNDQSCGDSHTWSVWHGGEPFEWYRTALHRFCSEFGFQSFPLPSTIASFTKPEDRNVASYVMECHQKCPVGNGAIIRQMLNWFRLPDGFENTVWLSQILHGLAIKYAVEHWRRNMPRCMGALYWQLNDCWPVASWSSIDSLHRWKALHYDAERFFAPYLVSAVEDLNSGSIEVHVTSDSTKSVSAKVILHVETVSGELVHEDSKDIHTPVNGSKVVGTHDLSRFLEKYSERDLIITVLLELNNSVVSRNLATFTRPKHLNLQEPVLTAAVADLNEQAAEIVVRTNKPALWIWLEIDGCPDARLSDNFFHLRAGEETHLSVRARRGHRLPEDLHDRLVLRELTSTYRD